MDVRVTGAGELQRLARDLKQAGEKDLRRELFRGLQRAGKPLKAAARQAALDELPKAGGLAAQIAASRWSVKTRTGRDPGVQVVGRGRANQAGKETDLRSLNRGRLRHPTFGHRGARYWKNQPVPIGWFDRAMERTADAGARREIVNAIDAVARKFEAGQ